MGEVYQSHCCHQRESENWEMISVRESDGGISLTNPYTVNAVGRGREKKKVEQKRHEMIHDISDILPPPIL